MLDRLLLCCSVIMVTRIKIYIVVCINCVMIVYGVDKDGKITGGMEPGAFGVRRIGMKASRLRNILRYVGTCAALTATVFVYDTARGENEDLGEEVGVYMSRSRDLPCEKNGDLSRDSNNDYVLSCKRPDQSL